MGKDEIIAVFRELRPEMITALLYALAIATAILIAKGLVEGFVQYAFFRLNDQIGKNIKVRVRGVEGTIIRSNTRWIEVRTKEGMELVSMRGWQQEEWTVLYDSRDNFRTRKTDERSSKNGGEQEG